MKANIFSFSKIIILARHGAAAPFGRRVGDSIRMNDLTSGAHALFQCVYHIEWGPKYRFNVLRKQSHREDMETILRGIAQRKDMKIEELAIIPDHVHIVVHVKPSMSLGKAIQLLKGISSREMFLKHPNLRERYRRGHYWSPGKFYRSVGSIDLEKTKKYVQEQDDIHQTRLCAY